MIAPNGINSLKVLPLCNFMCVCVRCAIDWRVHFENIRIIGGKRTTIARHPYVACYTVKNFDACACGSVIIGKNWLVTAAHCVIKVPKRGGQEVVYSNATVWRDGIIRNVASSFAHPKYKHKHKRHDYDIGLLRVEDEFTASCEKPIPLADGTIRVRLSQNRSMTVGVVLLKPQNDKFQQYHPGTLAQTIGWGYTVDKDVDSSSETLLSVTLPLISLSKCQEKFATRISRFHKKESVTDRMLCTFAQNRDTCNGDSGGPLVKNGILIGIISWGEVCGGKRPGVFTDVSVFHDWLQKFMNKGNYR